MSRTSGPVVLCVLDGWGIAPPGPGNAIRLARTPRIDALMEKYPRAQLEASGRAVGLPDGVMGNSEVGHLTMGAGYVQYQDLVRIGDAIADGSFFRNDAFVRASRAVRGRGRIHLLGLLSTGGVHADLEHLNALADLARREGADAVYHAFLDGRDMPPRSAHSLLPKVVPDIATIQGRYWAMDRDHRWDRTERAWRAIVDADGPKVATAAAAIDACYERPGCRDELMEPAVVGEGARIKDGDAVVFFNFRPDRARQLTRAFMEDDFEGFARKRRPRLSAYVTMSDYKLDLRGVDIAFPQQPLTPIAAVIAERGLRQFHTAETEKYAHVTYFFNGGREEPFPGEERVLVPSPKVATYDQRPEMSAAEVARTLASRLREGADDFAIVNFANPDMVGHTGVIPAAVRAMEVTDAAVGTVVDAALARGGTVLLTADHGNAEEMLFPDGSANTQHSTLPVPVVAIGAGLAGRSLRDGELKDIAPTLLELMGLPVPERMTGRSLLS